MATDLIKDLYSHRYFKYTTISCAFIDKGKYIQEEEYVAVYTQRARKFNSEGALQRADKLRPACSPLLLLRGSGHMLL